MCIYLRLTLALSETVCIIITIEANTQRSKKMNEIKNNIETLAKEEGKSELEIISILQAAAAKMEDNETLEALCEIKWEYI